MLATSIGKGEFAAASSASRVSADMEESSAARLRRSAVPSTDSGGGTDGMQSWCSIPLSGCWNDIVDVAIVMPF